MSQIGTNRQGREVSPPQSQRPKQLFCCRHLAACDDPELLPMILDREAQSIQNGPADDIEALLWGCRQAQNLGLRLSQQQR